MKTKSMPRRTFIEKLLVAAGIASSGGIAGSAYVAMSGKDQQAIIPVEAGEEWSLLEAQAQFVPAKAADTAEISLHPSLMPRTVDYTLYEAGEYKNISARSGPLVQEVHFQIGELVAEPVPGATMDYWTFDGTVPGPMIAHESATRSTFSFTIRRIAAFRTT
jgi:hypothetical protein